MEIVEKQDELDLAENIAPEAKELAKSIDVTDVAGYVHWRLTGEKVPDIGDASGVFSSAGGYLN
jgi:hypothetical protein